MYIKEIYIKSFGAIIDRKIEFDEGLNLLTGSNECGKSTVVMFIKFMLYGLSGKAVGNEEISEREHYVNWENGIAAGQMIVNSRGTDYLIEKRIYKTNEGGRDTYRESSRLTDLSGGEQIKTAKCAGEYFFGFPEKVFMQSAFVKNIDSAKIDGGGLKVALENLMTSGSEEINTKRALEKLDAARKMLRHKIGNGGKIAVLEKEKSELTELLEESRDASKRILELESALADVSSKREKRDGEASEKSAICRAYEAVRIGSKVKSIEEGERTVASLERELNSLNPSINRELIAKIDICAANVKETEHDIETLEDKRRELEEKCRNREDEEPESVETVLKKAKKLRMWSVFCLSAACSAAVFAVICALALIIPHLRSRISQTGHIGFVIAAFVLLAAVFAAGFTVYKRLSSFYEKHLESWNSEDEVELEGAVMAKTDSYKYTKKMLDSIERIDSITEEAITKHDREIDRGMEYGEALGISGPENVFEVLDEARERALDICRRREEITSQLESARGRLSAILEDIGENERGLAADAEKEALEGIDREMILKISKDEYLRLCKERDFALSAASALREREENLKRTLAALGAAGKTPSETAGRISVIDDEIAVLTEKHASLVMAYEALERAGEKMRGDVMPRVTENAARIMENVTGGRYDSLSSGENLDLSVTVGGAKKTVDFLSEGTKDASYVSIRASLVKTMYGEDMPVMIFDECFARIDRDRLSVLFGILSAEGMPQCIVCTCRKEEVAAAEGANVISL
ncbi:MAG: AAA family ATPase [Clostridia bacterium]|nr:AAA family ATPase [Clostridia bacterium]